MRCANCDREFDETGGDCPYCGAVPDKELNRQTAFNRMGEKPPEITINEDGFYEGQGFDRREWRNDPRARVWTARFPSGILGSLLLAAILLFSVFVLLPAFIFIALGLAAAWFIYRLFA
ncbi:MAG: hypothetical protein LBO03_01385 [Acidaminococcales bacterium]|jgi:hypothetical protein|nr:hypothetical protein [Acidaminococcales bacterium]